MNDNGGVGVVIAQVPDVEGSNEHRCQLTRTPYGRLFNSEVWSPIIPCFFHQKMIVLRIVLVMLHFYVKLQELNMYMKFLFELIVARGPSVGLDVALNRFDLFHGHLFLAVDSGRLGILYVDFFLCNCPLLHSLLFQRWIFCLYYIYVGYNLSLSVLTIHNFTFGRFHAREYPAYDKEVFRYNLGFCQRGTILSRVYIFCYVLFKLHYSLLSFKFVACLPCVWKFLWIIFASSCGSALLFLCTLVCEGEDMNWGEFMLLSLRAPCKWHICKWLIFFSLDTQSFQGIWFLECSALLSGSNVTYDDSMNMRNILWLAPLPGDSAKSWVAPGTFNTVIISIRSLNASHLAYTL